MRLSPNFLVFLFTIFAVDISLPASAAVVVDWEGNYVSENVSFGRDLAYSDTVPLNPRSNYAGKSAVFYGGAQTANGLTGFTDSGPFNTGVNNIANSNASRDLILFYWQGTPSATTEGVVIWKKANFLGRTASSVVYFDSQSSLIVAPNPAASIRFVVQDGNSYYVSQASYTADTTVTLSNPNVSTMWAVYTPSLNIDFNAATASFSPHSFTNIQAVGYYFEAEAQGFAEYPFAVQQFTANASIKVEDQNACIQYDGWRGFKSTSANGGFFRMSNITNDTVTYAFTGTSIKWITRKAPSMGIAAVAIDGISRGNYDLYSSSPVWNQQVLFDGLLSGSHKIVVKVTGTRNASATDVNVAMDGFLADGSTVAVQESAVAVQYNNWVGKTQSAASGVSYRINGNVGTVARLNFNGNSINLITVRGPTYGMVDVYIDRVLKSSNLDLYSATQQWQYLVSYSGLSNANHTIEIRPSHTKNASSSGYGVVVDAFKGPFTPLQ